MQTEFPAAIAELLPMAFDIGTTLIPIEAEGGLPESDCHAHDLVTFDVPFVGALLAWYPRA